MTEIRFKEPRWIWMIFVLSFGVFWPFMWTLAPILGRDEMPGFMRVVFVVIGLLGASFGWTVAVKMRAAGFTFTVMGIEGAADREDGLVPWPDVVRLGWQADPSMRVNGVPVTRLVAGMRDSSVLRVSTLGVANTSRWERQLEQARLLGVLPGHVELSGSVSSDDHGRAAAELHALLNEGIEPAEILAAARRIRAERAAPVDRAGWIEDVVDAPENDAGTPGNDRPPTGLPDSGATWPGAP